MEISQLFGYTQVFVVKHKKEKWPLHTDSNHNTVMPPSMSLHQGNSKDFTKNVFYPAQNTSGKDKIRE